MEPITGLAQENNDGMVEYYDRWRDDDGHVHHRLTHIVVTATGETLRSPGGTPAEKMRRYLQWRADWQRN